MLVRPSRRFPGTALLLRGTSIAHTWPWLLAITAVSVPATAGYYLLADSTGLTLTTIPFSLVGLALSIFLGFRNNACYDRWWEARKLWGRLINTTRSTARQLLTLVAIDGGGDDDDEIAAFKRETVWRVIAFAHALKVHLRSTTRLDILERLLPADEHAALSEARNVPQAVLHRLGERLVEARGRGWIGPYEHVALEASLTDLTDIQGGCERIKNTPVPLSYTVLTHRIVGIYCFTLPFGIVGDVGLLTPLVVLLVSFAFLGLDAVGTQIEDPFEEDPNDLPLAAMARTIEIDLRQRLGDTDLPAPLQPVKGILLKVERR